MSNRPLIFLGSNVAMAVFGEVCKEIGINVVGIIDKDYYGNTEEIGGIPVIDSEDAFDDPVMAKEYRDNYDFFCAVNWMPMTDPVTVRNREKRTRLLNLIDQHDLGCATIIDPRAKVSPTAKIGRGVYIDAWCLVDPGVSIGDFTHMWSYASVGFGCHVGRNCVIQRSCNMTHVTLEDEVYLAPNVSLFKLGAVIGHNTFIQECIYLRRGTVPNEIISINGSNTRRVYTNPITLE